MSNSWKPGDVLCEKSNGTFILVLEIIEVGTIATKIKALVQEPEKYSNNRRILIKELVNKEIVNTHKWSIIEV